MNSGKKFREPGFTFWLSRIAVRAAAFSYWRCRVSNAERMPMEGPVILASNHVSFADPPLIGSMLPRPAFTLARSTLFHPPWFGNYLRALLALPIDRDGGGGAGLKVLFELLAAGRPVVLFPEGTRSADGRIQPARGGLGMLVIKSRAPVLPVRLFGVFEAYPRTRKLPRPGRVELKFGQLIRFDALADEAEQAPKARVKAIYQEVSDSVMRAIEGLTPGRETDHFP
jgi:1-acyl-sn-glycerol-3-phosphate acyltransferase